MFSKTVYTTTNSLPDKVRIRIVELSFQGLSTADICDELELSKACVRKYLRIWGET